MGVDAAVSGEGESYGRMPPGGGGGGAVRPLFDDTKNSVMRSAGGAEKDLNTIAVTVHCHQAPKTLSSAAGGDVNFGPWDEVKGNSVRRVNWNPARLPGTVLLSLLFVLHWFRSHRLIKKMVRVGTCPDTEEARMMLTRARAVSYERIVSIPGPGEIWRTYVSAGHHHEFSPGPSPLLPPRRT